MSKKKTTTKIESRRNKPLTVTVTRDGVLTIEIGVATNAFAFLASPYAWKCTDPKRRGKERDPREVFDITDMRGFALDVKSAMLDEREDGSSLLTDLLDKASQQAVEDGSEFFVDKDSE